MPETRTSKLLREMSPAVSVGILTANLLSLGSELQLLEDAGVRLAHVDVMDGSFCPMMTVGPPFIRALKGPLLKDIHLMISEPFDKVSEFVEAGADIITVHAEAGRHIHRTLQQIGAMSNIHDSSRGLMRGVALCPGTPLEVLEPLWDELELVSLLAVNPGWRGREFISSTWKRIEKVKGMIEKGGREALLAVDGGITRKNIAEVAAAGADIIVTGSAVFDGKAPRENARFMLEAVKQALRSQKSEARSK